MEKYFELTSVARKSIESKLKNIAPTVDDSVKKKFSKVAASFVTLTINGQLRGCIGSIEPHRELWKDVVDNARSAAFGDPRFPSLSAKEFDALKIEVSVLGPITKIDYKSAADLLKKIRKNRGLLIRKSIYSATYLPQVWEQLPDKEEFLSSLCAKAGLPSDEWKDGELEVFDYTVTAVEE